MGWCAREHERTFRKRPAVFIDEANLNEDRLGFGLLEDAVEQASKRLRAGMFGEVAPDRRVVVVAIKEDVMGHYGIGGCRNSAELFQPLTELCPLGRIEPHGAIISNFDAGPGCECGNLHVRTLRDVLRTPAHLTRVVGRRTGKRDIGSARS